MTRLHTRALSSIGIALCFLTAASGCKKDEPATTDTTANHATASGGTVDTAALAPPVAPPSWSNAAIIGYVEAANKGEEQIGKIAEKKATDPAVKAYAKQLAAEHKTMLAEIKALSTKLNTVGDTTVDDVRGLINHGRDVVNELTSKPAGTDWDKNFIDKMIDGHKNVLDWLQKAGKSSGDTDLRAALEKASGKVQEHLTKAEDIKAHVLKS